MSDSLRPHGLQHPGFPCPSPAPRVCSNSCPLNRWCYLTISSSVVSFSSRLQSFPVSGSFQMNQFFTSGGQSIGVSASALVLPMNIQGWFPLGLTGLIFLSKGHSRVLQHHSSKASILQSAAFFIYSLGICASKFPFPLIQFSITFSGKKPESWIKHLVVRMHPCLLASPPFTAMCS